MGEMYGKKMYGRDDLEEILDTRIWREFLTYADLICAAYPPPFPNHPILP